MESRVKIIFSNLSPEEAQKLLWDFLDNLKDLGKIKDYEFEIVTDDGKKITNLCILEQGKVIA